MTDTQTELFWSVILLTLFFYFISFHIHLKYIIYKVYIKDIHKMDRNKFVNHIAPKCSSRRMCLHELLWTFLNVPLITYIFMSKMEIAIPLIGGFLITNKLVSNNDITFLREMDTVIPGILQNFIYMIIFLIIIIINFISIIIIACGSKNNSDTH